MVIKNKGKDAASGLHRAIAGNAGHIWWFLNSRYPDGITWETLSDLVPRTGSGVVMRGMTT